MADEAGGKTTEATFAFVDLAGFTAMTEAHGDTHAVSMIRAFHERTTDVLGSEDELVKAIGDAVMLRFASPEGSVVALRHLLEQELRLHDTLLLPRAGAHHGPAVAIEGDYCGAAVNLAARVAGQARGGQLLVTDRVAMAARATGATITHVGCLELRNVSEAVDIFDVSVTDDVGSTVTDPVCQMRVPTTGASAVILEWSGRHLYFCGLPCVARFAADPATYLRRLPDP